MKNKIGERKQNNFFAGKSDVRKAFFAKQPMILLVYKEAALFSNQHGEVLPTAIVSLLQEFKDIVVRDMATGLPPIRGMSTKLTLYPGPRFQTDRPTEPTLRKRRSCNGKSRNFCQRGTLERA